MTAANLKRTLCVLALAASASCSLMVDYDLEGKPCGNNKTCRPGYVCIQNGCWLFDEDAGAQSAAKDAAATADASRDAATGSDAGSGSDAADEADAGLGIPDV